MRDQELAGLARTLGRDHHINITIGGDNSTCSADGSRINIARMPASDLGKRLMCGLVFHEIGHKIFTSGSKPAGLLGELSNIIEDIRVEQLTMQQRPGTRFDLESVTNYYIETYPLNPDSVPAALLGLAMAVGRGTQLKQQQMLPQAEPCRQYLQATFDSGLVDTLEQTLHQRLPRLSSTQCSLQLAQELLDRIRKEAQPQQEDNPERQKPEQEEDEQQPQPVTKNRRSAADSSASDPSGDEPERTRRSHSAEELEALLSADSGGVGDIQAFLTGALDQLSAQTPYEQLSTVPEYPEISRNQQQTGHLDTTEALVASSRMRAKLPGLLQSLKNMPVSYGCSGRKLALNRLIHLASGNPRIFRKKQPSLSVNTAVIILLDTSGSMYNKPQETPVYEVANSAAFTLHHCLSGIPGISVSTIAFAVYDDEIPDLQLVCDFKEKANSSRFDLIPEGGTPTNSALWYARAALLQRPEPRRIILLLTDGDPNHPGRTRAATLRCIKDGIEIAAIGIMTDAVKEYWKNHRVISQLNDLPRAMFGVMEGLLGRG